jgi:glycosyltransferase involved in cell wall biosynthesis
MEKRISIIIPCYNVEDYIERCIQSLLSQTFNLDELELIFVNDASTDSTYEILQSYEQKYSDSIMLINLEENHKQGGARNIGLQYASAEYIGFVDSDDWVEPTMYEKLFQKALEYNCDMVTCEYKRDFGKNLSMGLTGNKDEFIVINDVEERKKFLMVDKHGGVWSKLYKKSLIMDNHIYFPEHMSYEDNYWLPVLCLFVERYYVLEEYLYHYFVNMESTTIRRNSLHHMDRLEIELMKLKTYGELGVFSLFHSEIEYWFIKLYYINTIHYLFTRYDDIPTQLFSLIQENVRNIFPNYMNNKYLSIFSNLETELLRTIQLDLKPEDWILIAKGYEKALSNK